MRSFSYVYLLILNYEIQFKLLFKNNSYITIKFYCRNYFCFLLDKITYNKYYNFNICVPTII